MKQQPFLSLINQVQPDLPGQGIVWVDQLRKLASNQFSDDGFPTPREEEWRYTNIAPIEKHQFSLPEQTGQVDDALVESARLEGCDQWVFVDGRYDARLSSVEQLPEGATLLSIRQAFQEHEQLVQSWLGRAIGKDTHGFIHFNTASFSDGMLVHLAPKVRLSRPVQLLFVATAQDTPTLFSVRNVIVAESGASGHVIETHVGPEGACYLSNAVSELFVAPNAQLRHGRFQNESQSAYHMGGVYVQQQEHSMLSQDNFSFGAALSRCEMHAELGTAADCVLNGLYIGQGRQHMDHHTRLNHTKPHAVSKEFYKGILADRSRGVFQGRIIVAEGALKTDADMGNRNLLLSDRAEVDSKPQLEIYADDVKCAHGVTIGQLEEESIFYLRSRAVDEETARNMLTFAFANEMVERIEFQPLRMQVLDAVLDRFPQRGMRREWL